MTNSVISIVGASIAIGGWAAASNLDGSEPARTLSIAVQRIVPPPTTQETTAELETDPETDTEDSSGRGRGRGRSGGDSGGNSGPGGGDD